MIIRSIFIKGISQRVKILQAENRKEISDELGDLHTDVSFIGYKSWVIESFILGINKIFTYMLDNSEGNITVLLPFKEELYQAVLRLNPLLEPEQLYISPSNNITLTKEPVKLTQCESWKVNEERSNLLAFDIEQYYKITDNARKHDHYTEVVEWSLVPDLHVTVRQYNKKLKNDLMQGFSPKSEDEVKYFVVVTCIDNIQALFSYLTHISQEITIPFNKVLDSLFDLAVSQNSFLKVKAKDFTKINKNNKVYQEGLSEQLEIENEPRLRKSLNEVPRKDILELHSVLSGKIFGQDQAIKAIVKCVQKAYNGLKNPKTPIGSFFLYGPTSTGKTELAKIIAKTLTKSNHGLVKISCNTLASSHNVHTLIGAPPGYVGYEERGLLAKALEKSQFKVILFDEIEKANVKVYDLILEMLEEGEIMMADGEIVNVSQSLIIFTSNMGQSEANNALNSVGFITAQSDEEQDGVQKNLFFKTLKETLKPEFLARLNGTFYFSHLKEKELLKVAQSKLDDYVNLLNKRKTKVIFSSEIPQFIIKNCKESNKHFHARDVRNYIDVHVIEQLGDFILMNLDKSTKINKTIKVELDSNNQVIFNLTDSNLN